MIDVLIHELDGRDGDPDLEPNGDDELAGDEADMSYPEWHSRGRHKLTGGTAEGVVTGLTGWPLDEGDEDDDPDTGVEDGPKGFDPEDDMCLAGDDRVASGSCTRASLLYEDTGPGDADDAEREQLHDDVPMIPVFALEPNPFNGERQLLGISNLQSSFVAARSARPREA
ncbi:MAG TPA: hypothetical protein VGQ28_17370 [Thermoanaerobaculia bacterium]|nr:hypothetical protein [Thermoanaerobaculia bacterium]